MNCGNSNDNTVCLDVNYRCNNGDCICVGNHCNGLLNTNNIQLWERFPTFGLTLMPISPTLQGTTESPYMIPTLSPSIPTFNDPTFSPTNLPLSNPSRSLTNPSVSLTNSPNQTPSNSPTKTPSDTPSIIPTIGPTSSPIIK